MPGAVSTTVWDSWDSDPAVTPAVEAARTAITVLRRHPANRTGWAHTAAVASVRAARTSAALDGAPLAVDPGTSVVTDPVLAGSLRVAVAIGSMLPTWSRSPRQVLARLHTLAAADLVPADGLGRPRAAEPGVPILAGLTELVTASPWPAPVQIAMVHGRLLAQRPFDHANGVVARAAARLTMMSTGFDPAGLGVPEVAHLHDPREYAHAAAAFTSGESGAVTAWVLMICRSLVVGAKEGASIADAAV